MTYVILPGRGAMIEYDNCHLSIMIIFEPYDYKSNNLTIRSHTTFDLSPHLVINSSHCTWVKVIRGRSSEVTMLTMEGTIRRTISTDLDLRRTSHQEYAILLVLGYFFCIHLLLTINYFVKAKVLS